MGRHFYSHYQFKTPCSIETPLQRKLGNGKELVFADPEKLIDFLTNSEEDDTMWTDSEDLKVIADACQISIKIVTVGRSKDSTLIVHSWWICPEESLKGSA